MTRAIRPTPPAVCNRNRDTAAPSISHALGCIDGRSAMLFNWLAQEQHTNMAGEPEAVPLWGKGRVKPDEFARLTALNKAACDALSLLEAEVDKCRRVSR